MIGSLPTSASTVPNRHDVLDRLVTTRLGNVPRAVEVLATDMLAGLHVRVR
jgi:hypothetical protein